MSPHELASCFGKEVYQSGRDARAVIKRIEQREQRRKIAARGKRVAYQCRHCHRWHVGHERP